MHLERRHAYEESWPRELRLVFFVVTDDVADILTHEALDAFMELLDAIDFFLVHAVRAVCLLRRGLEGGHALGLLVVVRDVGHQVLDDRERSQRGYANRLARRERIHAGHAHEPGTTIDLGAARPAPPSFT